MPKLRFKHLTKGLFRRLNRLMRVLRFSLLSTNDRIIGRPEKNQPVFFSGLGSITFGKNVKIGVSSSPGFWSTYCYLDSRGAGASINIGSGTWINNGFAAIAEKRTIDIGRRCLIGHDVVILDSNFHSLDPNSRHSGGPVSVGDVIISDNVFIGSRVVILKNTKIGSGSVVAAGAVLAGDFPANCLIAGNPAVVIRNL
ncbi:acyltransferase [Marinobacter sp. M3C]|uniref:acyltransferase n=1 Tax=Marinobacter sp. M3C TaxID=2917715 RepID=UPI00200C934F|nr:acyltransferase [Marinobacter sp. M3C]MCL1485117.1 acyltransferase [Marinobacter sp.]UQG61657.1 acyltransferase [Marinobacter sp. M3C]